MDGFNQSNWVIIGLLIILIAIRVSEGEILHCFHSSSNMTSLLVTRCVHVAILGPESNVCFSWRRLSHNSSEQVTEERGCQRRDLLLADLDEEQRQKVSLDDSSFCTQIKDDGKSGVGSSTTLCLCTTDLCNTKSLLTSLEKYKNAKHATTKINAMLLIFSILIAFIGSRN